MGIIRDSISFTDLSYTPEGEEKGLTTNISFGAHHFLFSGNWKNAYSL